MAQNERAVAAFLQTKDAIDLMLERIIAASRDHFGRHPDEITWGDVGDLQTYASLLRRIVEPLYKEGEHAR
jgi:hypothetical protein